jgi:hypothetical protein
MTVVRLGGGLPADADSEVRQQFGIPGQQDLVMGP